MKKSFLKDKKTTKPMNKDFEELTVEEFDKTILGLSSLAILVPAIIMQNNLGGVEAAAECILDLEIAADALEEIKCQVHGIEPEPDVVADGPLKQEVFIKKRIDNLTFAVDRKEGNNKEYTWETSENKEVWQHDDFESIEECIEDYLKNYAADSPQDVIFVGECERYGIYVDGSTIIDNLQEQAYDECGECSEGWEPSLFKNKDDWRELDEQLTEVVTDWLEKHNDMPSFCSIVNVIEVPVKRPSME